MSEIPSSTGLSVDGDIPMLGVPTRENGREVVRYFAEDLSEDTSLPPDVLRRARAAIGSWGDMDWEATKAALDRIRHESAPTPPIGLEL